MSTVPTRSSGDTNASADINTLQDQITANKGKVNASDTDTDPGSLTDKMVAGSGITLTLVTTGTAGEEEVEIKASQTIGLPCRAGGALYVGTNITSTPAIQFAGKVTKIIANVDSAPTDAAIELNMQKNGSNDILSSELSIAAGATSGSSTSIDTTYDDFVQGDYATLDISQIGSTLPGTTLRVTLVITPT
jgi:hypothetical protein